MNERLTAVAAKARRYNRSALHEPFHTFPDSKRCGSPDEYPFTAREDLPAPVLEPFLLPKLLHDNDVNANASILSFYVYSIVPAISRQATLQLSAQRRAAGIKGSGEYDDDGNYGSVATIDVQILQAISKRVHYGESIRVTQKMVELAVELAGRSP